MWALLIKYQPPRAEGSVLDINIIICYYFHALGCEIIVHKEIHRYAVFGQVFQNKKGRHIFIITVDH